MSDAPRRVADLSAARSACTAEAAHREALRLFVVVVQLHSIGILPPGGDPDMSPETEILDAADLVSDPGRIGEIARAMVARADGGKAVDHG